METVFLAEDGFREEVVYVPAGGVARTIWAIVLRSDSVIRDENNHLIRLHKAETRSTTDSVEGINAPKIGDTLRLDSKVYSCSTSRLEAGEARVEFTYPEILNAGPQNRFRL